jgi:hypothetical protein
MSYSRHNSLELRESSLVGSLGAGLYQEMKKGEKRTTQITHLKLLVEIMDHNFLPYIIFPYFPINFPGFFFNVFSTCQT